MIDETVALTPSGGGGICISMAALQPADIIVSTTTAVTSAVIRLGTLSAVSHAALYGGPGMIIEAISPVVTKHAPEKALQDDVLAVAYRHPAMSPEIAAAIIRFAEKQVGQPYSRMGAIASRDFILCEIAGRYSSGFFCSQLVLEAYRAGGLPLTSVSPACVTPSDVVVIAQHKLRYVGHIKGNPALLPVLSP
jgi:cell wall-associated NlpC family hydrolase